MANKFPRHSRDWCAAQLDLLGAREDCRQLSSARDYTLARIDELGGRRPKDFDSAIQISQACTRLVSILTGLLAAAALARRVAADCGEDASRAAARYGMPSARLQADQASTATGAWSSSRGLSDDART
jgi:hypothetical protein